VFALTKDLYCDISGNVTQTVVRGDITGEGILTQTATNSFTYTAKNLPNTTTDPSANAVQRTYDATDPFLLTTLVQLNGGTPIATNNFYYTNVATLSSSGTHFAFGPLSRTARPGGAANAI